MARAPGAEFEAAASCLPLLLTARCHPQLKGHPGPGFQSAMWLSSILRGCTSVYMHTCVHDTLWNCNCTFANSACKCTSSHKSCPPAPPLSLRSLPFPRLEDQAHPLLSKAAFSLFAGPQPSEGLWAPVSSMVSFCYVFNLFPLASSSTYRHPQASPDIGKHRPSLPCFSRGLSPPPVPPPTPHPPLWSFSGWP